MRDYNKLLVWQRAHALAIGVHEASRGFATGDFVSLKSQLTRAADSIAANIVEGCGAASQKELARYLDIAIKSANETEYHLRTASDRQALAAREADALGAEAVEVRRMLYGLRKRVLASVLQAG